MDRIEFLKKYFSGVFDKQGHLVYWGNKITKSDIAERLDRFTGYYYQMKDAWRKGIGTSEFIDDNLTLEQYLAVMTAQEKYGVRYWKDSEYSKEKEQRIAKEWLDKYERDYKNENQGQNQE